LDKVSADLSSSSIAEQIRMLQTEADWLLRAERALRGGVVRLLDDRTLQPIPFIVLERASGTSLGARMDRGDEFTLEVCLGVMKQVAACLERLHADGLFHYDISLDNIIWDGRSATLIDPSPDDWGTSAYTEPAVKDGARRDVLALGRTVAAMYCDGLVDDIPEEVDLDDYPIVYRLLKRSLNRSRYKIPSAKQVRSLASRAYRAYCQ
jgi:tRNA A-37 threonylcarbamoyl transferase component Bud32